MQVDGTGRGRDHCWCNRSTVALQTADGTVEPIRTARRAIRTLTRTRTGILTRTRTGPSDTGSDAQEAPVPGFVPDRRLPSGS
jgi:hypothetical protein